MPPLVLLFLVVVPHFSSSLHGSSLPAAGAESSQEHTAYRKQAAQHGGRQQEHVTIPRPRTKLVSGDVSNSSMLLLQGSAVGRALLAIPAYERGEQYSWWLPESSRDRGISYYGSAQRLRAKLLKLKAKRGSSPLRVVTIGGSVTAGLHGVGDGHSWPQYLFNYLNDTFPGRAVGSNGAVPATISSYMCACVNMHVPRDTDVVLVEYTVNDVQEAKPLMANEFRRAYERLLRKLLALPSRPAVVLMHAYAWMAPVVGTFWNSPEREFAEFAWFYDLPMLSVKAATYHHMRAGEEGFQVDRFRSVDPPESIKELAGKAFYFDKIHPDNLSGQRAMGELAMHLFARVLEGLEQRPLTEAEAEAAAEEALPEPMIAGNHQSASDKCFIGQHFQDVVTLHDGFEWADDSSNPASPKWGFIALEAGATLEMALDTTASTVAGSVLEAEQGADSANEGKSSSSRSSSRSGSGSKLRSSSKSGSSDSDNIAVESAKKNKILVQLVHLKSYKGLGQAVVRCKGGCSCNDNVLQGHQPEIKNSQLYLHDAYVTQSAKCIVAIKTMAHPDTKASKVKLSGVIISEEVGGDKAAKWLRMNSHAVEMVHTVSTMGSGTFDARNKPHGLH